MSTLSEIRDYDPLHVGEALFEEVKHPRGRAGKWVRGAGGKIVLDEEPRLHTDVLGARLSWDVSPSDEENHHVELYGGEWTRSREKMVDSTWRDVGSGTTKISVGMAMDHVHPARVASAHLRMANAIGGTQGAAMKRSLKAALAKRGLAIQEAVSGFDPLFLEEYATSAILFDPSLHPRGRKGEFTAVLSRLDRKVEVHLPHGITVQKGRVGGFKVTDRVGGVTVHDPESAAHHALVAFDNVQRRSGVVMQEPETHFLVRRSPGGERETWAQRAERVGPDGVPPHVDPNEYVPDSHLRMGGQRPSRAQALVDAGLADDLAHARAQLADMGDTVRGSPGGERGQSKLSELSRGDEFHWQGVRYRHEGTNQHGADRVNATKLHGGEAHVLPSDTLVEPVSKGGSTIVARGRSGEPVVIAQTRRVDIFGRSA